MIEDIGLELRKAAKVLQEEGIRASIPQSEFLFSTAQEARLRNPDDPDTEYHWRAACLIYGAMLAKKGKWSDAYRVFSSKGHPRGGEGAVSRLPATTCVALTAMMALGEAVARVRNGNDYAEEAASEAVRWLTMLGDGYYNAWNGTALLVIALCDKNRSELTRELATYARELLAPQAQPELCVLADHLAGNGDGIIRISRFRKRTATLQAGECLYLFNAPL